METSLIIKFMEITSGGFWIILLVHIVPIIIFAKMDKYYWNTYWYVLVFMFLTQLWYWHFMDHMPGRDHTIAWQLNMSPLKVYINAEWFHIGATNPRIFGVMAVASLIFMWGFAAISVILPTEKLYIVIPVTLLLALLMTFGPYFAGKSMAPYGVSYANYRAHYYWIPYATKIKPAYGALLSYAKYPPYPTRKYKSPPKLWEYYKGYKHGRKYDFRKNVYLDKVGRALDVKLWGGQNCPWWVRESKCYVTWY